jgi:sugar O-acyltransferase (sialic acid O-acetyltransferase NeuD family)
MEKVVIFGTSMGARLAWFAMSHDPRYEVAGFTVDRAYIKEPELFGLPVTSFEDIEQRYPTDRYRMLVAVLANGMNKLRAEKYQQAKDKGYTLISYVHPQTIIAPDLAIGDNCFIHEGVLCRPFTQIGNDVTIMAGAVIGHDVVIKDHCFIGNRAVIMGKVTMEPYCFVGPNATVLEAATLGAECLIGGGAVIQESVKPKEVYKAAAPVLLPLPSDKLAKFIFRRQS